MQSTQTRRRLLKTLSLAPAAGQALAEEAPLETTRIRRYEWNSVCIAPQFVAEELLRSQDHGGYVALSVL
jgi:NitT/TauT family transport system substrate-binding protein